MKDKILLSVIAVSAIILITVIGATYAYYAGEANTGGIQGEAMKFDVSLQSNPIYEATKLVPLKDNDIVKSISKSSNPCIDNSSYNYQVCSLYELTLTNAGDAEVLNGYIETSATTYTTSNLKYQLFTKNGATYTNLTMLESLPQVVGSKTYFKGMDSNIKSTTVSASSSTTFYLAIWLSDTGTSQNEDFEKAYTGKVVFESINGNRLESSFSA